ncbi:tail fiber protein [Rhodanobacter sp. C01]|uniref:phage tail protein n=1 Tax=Rhodanobacter sp. C01 TaxID=1945856 RepID=UPI00098436FD|nr:tail fiber protein [Rhodanobacter sp. C01]OOG50914.1 microcystin-dependent protein [Rhodanobacter sp. C01]
MSEFYIGQIMLTGFGFAPRGFAQCNGQTMSIQQNQALFSLIGITYGGNGIQTFMLPNLQGRTPTGAGSSVDPGWQPTTYPIGQMSGVENVTLLTGNMPAHAHTATATTQTGTLRNPTNAVYASASESLYGPATANQVALNPAQIGMTGGNLPHPNMQPFRVINFNIALSGIFPSRN